MTQPPQEPETFARRIRRQRALEAAAAAARLLGEEGCFRFRVEDVARATGVAKGSVYLDHGSKASLAEAALAWACEELRRELARRVEATADPRSRLPEVVRSLARLTTGRPDLTALLDARLACAARWIGADASPYEELERYVAGIAAEALAAAGLRQADPRLVAEGLLALAGTRAWARLAARGPRHLMRQLEALMPGLFPGRGVAPDVA